MIEERESSLPFSNKKNNILIKQRPEIGKVRQPAFDLPQDKPFGKASYINPDGGVKELTMSWNYHQGTHTKQGAKDFMQMNKVSIKNNVKQNELLEWRKQNEQRRKIKEGQKHYEVLVPSEEFLFGKKVRPSTPVKNILSYEYGNKGTQEKLQIYDELKQQTKKQKLASSIQGAGKSIVKNMSIDRYSQQDQEKLQQQQKLEEFKLDRYRKVDSKIGKKGLKTEAY